MKTLLLSWLLSAMLTLPIAEPQQHAAQDSHQTQYWKAYTLYHNGVQHLKAKDRDQAKALIAEGIDIMDVLPDKNSEDYTLLSLLNCFSCQFYSFPRILKFAKASKRHIREAMALDPANPRAYYILAFNDYHTPEKFGGGKLVEQNALKALSLFPAQPQPALTQPATSQTNASQQGVPAQTRSGKPAWGRQECLELLSNWYIRKKNYPAAEKYTAQGLAEFPQSKVLQENRKKLSQQK